ncbi:MAG: enoyl-CoA hydratase/isomerase family protein [Actinomycetia bacterium]|nr:enoyl-CoA hydratase/isomerase family protein [Actinomycetes bacterium]
MPIVSYRMEDTVATLQISRPDRRNALNHAGVAELLSGVDSAVADGARVLVITGDAGHFCAGADLKELEDLTFTRLLRKALDALAETPFPTIAAIEGSCMGLGAQIALACDLRVADESARFAVPVAKLGLMVDHWTLQRLALLVGHSMARWLTMTAKPITAEQAAATGFVHEILPAPPQDDSAPAPVAGVAPVLSHATALAHHITLLAPLSLAGTKRGLNQLERDSGQLDPNAEYVSAFELAWASEDLKEGQAAFTERRRPNFRGA